jgi:hypothetical protein
LTRKVDITNVDDEIEVKFLYSVKWYKEKLEWKDRLSRYSFKWLSIIHSFVLVLLLAVFLTIIMLRIIKNNFLRCMELDDEALKEEEVGTLVSLLNH